MRTALLTGANGFTGRYLEPALQQRGYEIARVDPPVPQPCDLTDRACVEQTVLEAGPDVVVHLAGITTVAHSGVEDFYRVNGLGTQSAGSTGKLERPPSRVIIASSANVYGAPKVGVLDESLCPAPVNHYACSRLAMEHMVRNWFGRLPIVIIRPFDYTGPGQADHFLIPKIVNRFRQRAPFIELGNVHGIPRYLKWYFYAFRPK